MSEGTFSRSLRFPPRVQPSRIDPYESPAPAADRSRSSDPLQELARLIGQSDPFRPMQDRAAPLRESQAAAPTPRAPVPPRAEERDYYQDQRDPRTDARQDRGYQEGQEQWSRQASAHAQAPDASDHYAGDSDDEAGYHHEAYAEHGHEDHDGEGEYAEEYAEGEEYARDDYAYEDEHEHGRDDEEDNSRDATAVLKRRNGAKIAAIVLGIAVFGSATAAGYRIITKGSIAGPPPVIHALDVPTKVLPTDAANKPINDRVSDGSAERLVRRDEDPVELRDSSRSTGSVVPGTGGPFPAVSAFPQAAAPAAPAASPGSGSEPKRVRTVTIRADQGMSGTDRAAAPPPARTTARSTQSAPPAAQAPAPLAIAPQSLNQQPAPPPQPVAIADAAPPPRAQAPAPRSADPSGGYVVQVSAQKSEAEAQASFRAMQAKYAELSGQQPLIRRKDQGDRGVFYAAQVGPFGTKDEAARFCETLKSAGGSCFVLRN